MRNGNCKCGGPLPPQKHNHSPEATAATVHLRDRLNSVERGLSRALADNVAALEQLDDVDYPKVLRLKDQVTTALLAVQRAEATRQAMNLGG